MHSTLHICTYASPYRRGVGQLETSCKALGVKLHVLGLEKPYRGFCDKFLAVQEFIKKLPEQDIVLFLDGYDTLLLAPPEEIVEKFLAIAAPIVVSAERESYPDGSLAVLYPPSPTTFRYVNSGLYIGFVGALRKFFKALSPFQAEDDDQALMAHFFLDHSGEMVLDTHCQLFLNTAHLGVDELATEGRRVFLRETETQPIAIHGNGKSLWYQYLYDRFFPEKYTSTITAEKKVVIALLGCTHDLVLQKQIECVTALDYPKEKIALFIDSYPATKKRLQEFVKSHSEYASVHFQAYEEEASEDDLLRLFLEHKTGDAHIEKAKQYAKERGDYFFLIDWNVFLSPHALKALLETRKACVAPMLRLFLAYCDFSLNFYTEPSEFMKIVRNELVGVFQVPFIGSCYLQKLDEAEEALFVSNEHHYGTMIELVEYPNSQQRIEQQELLRLFFQKEISDDR